MITTAAAWARTNATPTAVRGNHPAVRTTALSTVHARLNRITTHAAVLLTRGREENAYRRKQDDRNTQKVVQNGSARERRGAKRAAGRGVELQDQAQQPAAVFVRPPGDAGLVVPVG